jgi:hypothetical protein
MTSAQRGHIAIDAQAAYIGDAAYVAPADAQWHKHKVISADFGVQELIDQLPPEVGSGLFAGGSHKLGVYVGGGCSIHPRLQDAIGSFLFAAAGDYAYTAPVDDDAPIHVFKVDAADDTSLPFITVRKHIPSEDGTNVVTEYNLDCRVTALQMTLPAMGIMRQDFTFMGRRPVMVESESAAGNAYEDEATVGLSCESSVALPDFAGQLPAGANFTGAQVIIANTPSRAQEEMLLGSRYADKFSVVSRGAIVRLGFKWRDSLLYRKLLYTAPSGGQCAWNPVPQKSPVSVMSASPALIPKPTAGNYLQPYSLTFSAPSVEWQMSSPILAGGQQIRAELIGIVTQADAGVSTWAMTLRNAKESYGL